MHAAVNARVAEVGDQNKDNMGDTLTTLLRILVDEGQITQEHAEVFTNIHDQLIESGLRQ